MIDAIQPERRPEPRIDVGAQQIARIYAQALIGAAESSGNTAQIVDELNSLVEILEEYPDLDLLLSSAMVKHEEKLAIVDRVFSHRMSPLFMDFLKVLAQHGRLDVLKTIQRQVRDLYDELQGRVRVQLFTATPLGGEVSAELLTGLRSLLGGEPEIETILEPKLIGGVVLRVGDTVYDGSVARQLERLRETMITRSVHEIQSRRDRFRYSS